jgi:hypothetical protein
MCCTVSASNSYNFERIHYIVCAKYLGYNNIIAHIFNTMQLDTVISEENFFTVMKFHYVVGVRVLVSEQ